MLSTVINAARNRAVETGRPAGVWIERLPGLREAATNIYYAEIPPVYAGDFLDSSVELFTVNGVPQSGTGTMSGNIFTWERADTTCRDYWNIVVPRGRTVFNCDSWASPNPLDQTVVREGDLIQIEGSDRKVPLKTVKMTIAGATSASSQNLWWYIYRGRNCAWNTGPDGAYTNERQLTGEYVIRWFDRQTPVSWSSIRSTTTVPMNPNVTGLKYKIYRQPIKLQAGSVKLPDGVCIDLSFSSVTNGNSSDPGIPFHSRTDTGNYQQPFWGAPNYPNDETPIILVFSPGGHVERMYFRMSEGLSNTANTQNRQWVWGGVEPFGQIHFLIGKIEKIIPNEYFLLSQNAQTNYDIQQKKNWVDLENFWVNVNPQTGFISTSIVDDFTVYGQPYFNEANTQIGAANPNNVYMSRYKARYARVAGGK